MKLHIEIINVVNIITGNNSKPFSLRDNVVASNNDYDHEDSLEKMSSLAGLSSSECLANTTYFS